MQIKIISKMDSRVVIYPLIDFVKSKGPVLVLTENRQLEVLANADVLDDNVEVLMIVESVENTLEEYNLNPMEYATVVYDSTEELDVDYEIIIIGNLVNGKESAHLTHYLSTREDEYLNKIKIVKFGAASKQKKSADTGSDSSLILKESVPFPQPKEVTLVESIGKFYTTPPTLLKVFTGMYDEAVVESKKRGRR